MRLLDRQRTELKQSLERLTPLKPPRLLPLQEPGLLMLRGPQKQVWEPPLPPLH